MRLRAKEIHFALELLLTETFTRRRFTLKNLDDLIKSNNITKKQAYEVLYSLIELGYLKRPLNHPKSYKVTDAYISEWLGFSEKEKISIMKKWYRLIMNQPLLLKLNYSKAVRKQLAETFDLTEMDFRLP